LPADLQPAQAGPPPTPAGSISVSFQPPSGKPLDSSCAPLFDFTDTAIIADPKAIWHAIMSNQIVGPISRSITFKLLASLLTPAPAAAHPPAAAAGGAAASAPAAATPLPADAVVALQVVFEDGQTLDFDTSIAPDSAGFIDQKIALAVPVDAYILREGTTDTYRYRVDLITPRAVKRGDWITDNKDGVFLSVG
jgi:hypothetical protein